MKQPGSGAGSKPLELRKDWWSAEGFPVQKKKRESFQSIQDLMN